MLASNALITTHVPMLTTSAADIRLWLALATPELYSPLRSALILPPRLHSSPKPPTYLTPQTWNDC
jgi:hypothetical protein